MPFRRNGTLVGNMVRNPRHGVQLGDVDDSLYARGNRNVNVLDNQVIGATNLFQATNCADVSVVGNRHDRAFGACKFDGCVGRMAMIGNVVDYQPPQTTAAVSIARAHLHPARFDGGSGDLHGSVHLEGNHFSGLASVSLVTTHGGDKLVRMHRGADLTYGTDRGNSIRRYHRVRPGNAAYSLTYDGTTTAPLAPDAALTAVLAALAVPGIEEPDQIFVWTDGDGYCFAIRNRETDVVVTSDAAEIVPEGFEARLVRNTFEEVGTAYVGIGAIRTGPTLHVEGNRLVDVAPPAWFGSLGTGYQAPSHGFDG
jgi:hypothetical protein